MKCPIGMEKKTWELFDEEVPVLECTLTGSAEKKLHSMSRLVYTLGKERFGLLEPRSSRKTWKGSRRTQRIADIRSDLRRLAKQYRQAGCAEQHALKDLRNNLREQLKSLRRAENHRQKRRERQKRRAQFTNNPFHFVTRLLGDKISGKLDCTIEEANEHTKGMYSDPDRDTDLGECSRLMEPELT